MTEIDNLVVPVIDIETDLFGLLMRSGQETLKQAELMQNLHR